MSWKDTERNNKYLPGMSFGFVDLLEDTGNRTNNGDKIFKCKCRKCGKIFERSSDSFTNSLKQGCIISCGCANPSFERDIGKLFAENEERILKAVKSLGQISGTTLQGILRKNLNKNNTSGYRGVRVIHNKHSTKYQARLTICGKEVKGKIFDTAEEAYQYRLKLEEVFFKPFIEEYEAQTGHPYRDENGKHIKEIEKNVSSNN